MRKVALSPSMARSVTCSRTLERAEVFDKWAWAGDTVNRVKPSPFPKMKNGDSKGEPCKLASADVGIVEGSIVPVRLSWSMIAWAFGPSTRRISEGMLKIVKLEGRSIP